jgi:hypothetical protein
MENKSPLILSGDLCRTGRGYDSGIEYAAMQIPWQQFLNPVHWMLGDLRQHTAQVGFGIKAV